MVILLLYLPLFLLKGKDVQPTKNDTNKQEGCHHNMLGLILWLRKKNTGHKTSWLFIWRKLVLVLWKWGCVGHPLLPFSIFGHKIHVFLCLLLWSVPHQGNAIFLNNFCFVRVITHMLTQALSSSPYLLASACFRRMVGVRIFQDSQKIFFCIAESCEQNARESRWSTWN